MAPILAFMLLLANATAAEKTRVQPAGEYSGMCDASAGIALGTNYFVAGNDEDNVLRLYPLQSGGSPALTLDCSSFLRVAGKNTEVDFEGAARLGNLIYWISSHGANKLGKYSPNRHRLFATMIIVKNGRPFVEPAFKPYSFLLDDLSADSRHTPFNLKRAMLLPPKSPGGLNIESLCATPSGHLLIGFRNPQPQNKALIVTLLNPESVIRGERGRFGNPVLLDLNRLGIRDMVFWRGQYYILAGAFNHERDFRIFTWKGPGSQPVLLPQIAFKSLNPEALMVLEGQDSLFVLSDDGTRKIEGCNCKELADPKKKRFRTARVPLENLVQSPP